MERSRGHRHSPSFSSTLLDAIYRSIDDGPPHPQQHITSGHLKRGMVLKEQDGSSSYQRDCMIEKWMEKKGSRKGEIPRTYRNSSSSSSDSSSKGGFSSSESELSTPNKPRYSASCYSIKKLKPIRTDTATRPQIIDNYSEPEPNPSYKKPHMKALKIYGEIKSRKNRDPISPGAKLAGFLNSLFNAKKAKGETTNFPKSGHSSTCSSASSFSRSCLSKKTSSSKGDTRCVRFCPNVSDEVLGGNKDHVPKGHKQEPLLRRREEAENMLKNYQKKRSEINGDVDEDEDDGASCASSDLFELDHLSGVGMRFNEELPLYETTNLNMNNTPNAFIM